MDLNMRITRSRGGGIGMTPRDRPPTPRASGATLRTPSPNRTRRSASAPPGRDEQTHGEVIQPQTDHQGHGNPDDNGGQPASDQSRPPTPNWTGFAPPPNFQEARENDRRAHEAGEESSHPTYSRIWNRTSVVAMEPLSIDHNLYLDYRDPQSIKFFNKGRERLPGDPFSGKNIFSWLKRLEIKANEFHWIPTLTIDGKLLTTHFAELSMDTVKKAAQEFQNEGQRKAQNSRMLFYCITASISQSVMDKLSLKTHLFTLEVRNKPIQDGVCMLKVLIDSYYASTRFTTIEIRKQLANLPIYMQTVAKGDVTRLCEHTRKLNAELEASGEKTLDLVANVLAALEKASNPVFQRWLEGRKNMWALKQLEWKDDASDLMDEAESFYLNLREGRSWKKPHDDRARAYALKASDASVSSDSSQDMEPSTPKKPSSTLKKYVKAFAATEKQLREQRYKWKQIPPKDGESTTKRVLVDGVRKKYYWCVNHQALTLHSPQECRKSEENRKKRKSPNKHEGSSKKKKRTYDKARIAFEALALLAQGNPTSPSNSSNCTEDSNQDSNFSGTTINSSSSKSSTESYKTAEYDTDES
ncbi:MAG: hypothetical protein ACK5N5_00310 [Synechococcales cyanobacterium]